MRSAMSGMVAVLVLAGGPGAEAQTPPPGEKLSVKEILAAERGETPEVRALVAGRDPNARDRRHQRTALMWAIFLNDGAAFDRLIAVPGADVNAKDAEDETALMQATEFAMKYNTAPMVEALIAHGADVTVASESQGFTPLMHAANGNAPAVASALLAKLEPRYIDARNSYGMTALIVGASVGATEVVRLLLAKGARVAATDEEGKTPLIQAAGHRFPGSLATVALLLNKGADPNARDKEGNTPLSEARKHGAAGVVELLQKSGAN